VRTFARTLVRTLIPSPPAFAGAGSDPLPMGEGTKAERHTDSFSLWGEGGYEGVGHDTVRHP